MMSTQAMGRLELGNADVVVTGAGGQLGGYLRAALERAGARVIGLGRQSAAGVDIIADITDQGAISRCLGQLCPVCVVHAGAYTDVDGCEREPARAQLVNERGSAIVAEAARAAGSHLVAVSTDFVFGNSGVPPFTEISQVEPLSVYGRSKLAGENAVLATSSGFAVARTAWLYGGAGKHFPRTVLTVLRDRGSIEVVIDEVGSPTFAGDLGTAVVELAATGQGGIFHLVNEGVASRHEFARTLASLAGFDPKTVMPTTTAEFLTKYPLPARRPANSALANVRAAQHGIRLRPWEQAVREYIPTLSAELGLSVHSGSGLKGTISA